ncbi:hypothetical protein MJ923_07780 [Shewanella sp. 3B26]|uniref:Uncharacterized protein n=1 Tax=Shewanella zhuhaiensis TaxID=2919576 RepID=A0AAJ1BG85_9GAMM|nr:hypothetical protein [Shewanella zhuhaiensis]MCH4294203.1 hypothetical protein [Shewanella zhuhaiensis]
MTLETETPEECEFFKALSRKQAERHCPRWREIERIAAVVRSAEQSSTAIAVALYVKGCRLPEDPEAA